MLHKANCNKYLNKISTHLKSRHLRNGRVVDHFAGTAANLISVVSNSYYGMLRGQIYVNLPPQHSMSLETIKIKMAVVSAKWSMETPSQSTQPKRALPLGCWEMKDPGNKFAVNLLFIGPTDQRCLTHQKTAAKEATQSAIFSLNLYPRSRGVLLKLRRD